MAWNKRVRKRRKLDSGEYEWWVEPDPDCRYCHSTGIIRDWVDYGSTVVSLDSYCSCIEEALPKSYNELRDDVFIWEGEL